MRSRVHLWSIAYLFWNHPKNGGHPLRAVGLSWNHTCSWKRNTNSADNKKYHSSLVHWQECIPVGCVLAAAVAATRCKNPWGLPIRGRPTRVSAYFQRCLPTGWGSAYWRGVWLLSGMSAYWRGICLLLGSGYFQGVYQLPLGQTMDRPHPQERPYTPTRNNHGIDHTSVGQIMGPDRKWHRTPLWTEWHTWVNNITCRWVFKIRTEAVDSKTILTYLSPLRAILGWELFS